MIDNYTDDAYRNQVKVNYEFSSWAGQTKVGNNNVRLLDFRIESEDLQEWKLEEKEELPASTRQQRVVRYIHSPVRESSSQRYVSTVFECNSVFDAHETLIDVVMTYMAARLPRCETRGLEIGDICFGSHGEVNLSVIFARFNILVEIQSAISGPAPVNAFAANVDSLILGRYSRTKESQTGN
jgi:hypothetical protein